MFSETRFLIHLKFHSMGTISQGILGGFSGKVGTVIGSSWKGINYMRGQSAAKRTKSTQAQLVQQAKFALVIRFVRSFGNLWSLTFAAFAIKMSAFNSAFRYAIQHAIKGEYPNLAIDYSLVMVSMGDLPNAPSPKAASTAKGQVTFTWGDNSGSGDASANDKAILVVYSPDKVQAVYTLIGALRNAATATLDVSGFSGLSVHAYLGFISSDGQQVANSLYLGEVTVA
jgi:Family of unknown function (DUF6266)